MKPPARVSTTETESRESLCARALQQSGFEQSTKPNSIELFYAPGRVNLIGEHLDYNGGTVLPCAISSGIALAIMPRSDDKIRLRSANFEFELTIAAGQPANPIPGKWVNYPLGVINELNQLAKDGDELRGLDLYYLGDLPTGAGVSSSAALEVVTASALNSMFDCKLDRIEIATLCQRAENNFVGVACGIMDQFAVTLCKQQHALKLNCNDLSFQQIPLRTANARFVLANTNQKREMATGYNARVAECKRALKLLSKHGTVQHIQHLAELGPEALEDLPDIFAADPVALRRVQHVVSEQNRVRDAALALQSDQLQTFGMLMTKSHVSLRDLFEVSSEPLDHLVNATLETRGTLGSRLTGAGFGGCTISLVDEPDLQRWTNEVSAKYSKACGLTAEFVVFDTAEGVSQIDDIAN